MKKERCFALNENEEESDQSLNSKVLGRWQRGCSNFYPKYLTYHSPCLYYKLQKVLQDFQSNAFELMEIKNKG